MPDKIKDALGYNPKESDTRKERHDKISKTIKGMLTDILTAFMFHTKLDETRPDNKNKFSNKKPPKTVRECLESKNKQEAFIESFQKWIDDIDYKDILDWSIGILNALPDNNKKQDIINILAKASLEIHCSKGNKHHDITGLIFCSAITEAKNTGAFYTTLPAATLGAHLMFQDIPDYVWTDYDKVTKIKIADFACGSGTLLIAAANYILEKVEKFNSKIKNRVAVKLLENCIYGFDIDNRAKFQTATGLGMISPSVKFKNLNIHSMKLGTTTKENGMGEGRIGSLELLNDKDDLCLNPPITSMPVDREESVPEIKEGEFQFAIMNPPYTISEKRHNQLSPKEKILVKQREKAYKTKYNKVSFKGGTPAFFPLIQKFLCKKTGKVTLISPSSFTSGESAKKSRIYLASHFHIKHIIVIYDPERHSFSGNDTDIGEIIINLERINESNRNKPTVVIKLLRNPTTENEAIECANSIINNKSIQENWIKDKIPIEEISKGNWNATQFAQNELYQIASRVKKVWTSNVGEHIDFIGSPNTAKETKICSSNDIYATPALYYNNHKHCKFIENEPDSHLNLKRKYSREIKALRKTSTLKIAWRIRLTIIKNFACRTKNQTLGGSWCSVIPLPISNINNTTLGKAITIILNSTPAKIGAILERPNRTLSYSLYSTNHIRRIPMPNLHKMSAKQIYELAKIYDKWKKTELSRLPDINNCPTQIAIDKAVCEETGFPITICNRARKLLTLEPMVTSKRYEERHNLL